MTAPWLNGEADALQAALSKQALTPLEDMVHPAVPWIVGKASRHCSSPDLRVDFQCSRCGDTTHRRYCCKSVADSALELYCKLHWGCVACEPPAPPTTP